MEELMPSMLDDDGSISHDMLSSMTTVLLNFRLYATLNVYHDEVEYWVKPHFTTWFCRFLVQQYDNKRWVSMFRMTKPAIFALAEVLQPHVQKQDTNYRAAILVLVRVACTLFKLAHGTNVTICSEMFAIGRSIISKILRDVVHGINDYLHQEISWPLGERLRETQRKFKDLCLLPAVVGALDGVQLSIAKLAHALADYYYFKTGGYSMNCQVVVDSEKRFLDLYISMLGLTNDSRMLRKSSLFNLATHGNPFTSAPSVDGFSPYLIADLGYPLLPWIVVPHKEGTHLSVPKTLLNRKLQRGRAIVENAFRILKQCFRELLGKSELHLTFLPDVVVCCAILHNILLRQSHDEVEDFFRILQEEGLHEEEFLGETLRHGQGGIDTRAANLDDVASTAAQDK